MSRNLIDRDRLKKEIHEKDIMGGLNYAWYIDHAELVDAVEVVHGEWKFIGDSEEQPYDCAWMCSVCGKMYWAEDSNMVTEDAHFCPNCGAKMDGEEKSDG